MAHDDLTDDLVDLEVFDSELEAPPAPTRKAPAKSSGQAGLLMLCGFGCAVVGLALSVGPLASWKAAQVMGSMDYLGVHGGTLFVGGMVLMGLGMLRRGQHAIIVNAEEAHGDTELFEEIATDVVQMRGVLDQLQSVASQMQHELGDLRRFCEAEANKPPPPQPQPQPQPATGDSQGEAVFRLAASLDKVGARIEERMKSQFSTLSERLDSVESSFEVARQAVETQIDGLADAQVPPYEAAPGAVAEDAPAAGPEAGMVFEASGAQHAPAPVEAIPAPPIDSPLGVLDRIEPDEPQAPIAQPAPSGDFSQGQNLADAQPPSAALPNAQPGGPWGGELQVSAAEAELSPEERERLLAETRLRQSLQNMQQPPERGPQGFGG